MNKNKNERTCRMDFRVSPAEKEKIIGIAKKCKISTSEYLRKRAFGYAVKAAPPEAFFYFMRDLKKLIKAAPTPKVEEEALRLFDNIYAQLIETTKQSKQEIIEEMMQWQALHRGADDGGDASGTERAAAEAGTDAKSGCEVIRIFDGKKNDVVL